MSGSEGARKALQQRPASAHEKQQLALPLQLSGLGGLGSASPIDHLPSMPTTRKRLSACRACPVRLVANHLKKLSRVSILRSSPTRSSRVPAFR